MSTIQIGLEFENKKEGIKKGILLGFTSNSRDNLEWLSELEKHTCINPLLSKQEIDDYLEVVEELRKEERNKLCKKV